MSAATSRPYSPFQPQQPTPTPQARLSDLEENIATMGAQGPQDYTGGITPLRVEEQYELNERKAIAFSNTSPNYYDLITTEPKYIQIIADGADLFYDINQQITSDSPKIFNGGSQTLTSRGAVRIWFQGVSASGTIRIIVFKR